MFAQSPAASAPAPAGPRTGLPGGYNVAGNSPAAVAARAAATAQAAENSSPQEVGSLSSASLNINEVPHNCHPRQIVEGWAPPAR